ncbi:DNA-directed RNA polymerase II subunit RPB7 [Thelohanellus kitauei]|uniref:DNA-directed RNA polymerase II subunit RPB7 n=1 Tax=Thelohanellus kitauei TaxID=669202 RepID=A0A0C2IIQ1_THEKT|nr:DNA-directed RNA polymerase II subunit RPB7 [Thelohanellus kitauei]
MSRDIVIHPKYLGPQLNQFIQRRLLLEVEGKCDGVYGFIIAVTTIDHIGLGKITVGQGFVSYPLNFKAVVFRPFKGEVLDAVVEKVNNVGIFAQAGPLMCFISRYNIPDTIQFDPSGGQPCYKSQNEESVIKEGDAIRLRLINIRVELNEISAAATIREDYLGKL